MDGHTKAGTWRTIRRLEKSIPQVKWYRGELMLMSLFVNIFALGLPIFILQVYDRILPNLGLTTMQFLVMGLVVIMILDFILKSIRAAVTTYTGARFEHLARVAAVDKILRTPQDVYERETPGAYLDKVNAIGVVKEFYSSQLGTLFIDLPFAVFFLGMIWFLGGMMVIVPIGLLLMFGIMAIIVGGNLRRAVDTRGQVDNRRYDFLIEIINGIHTVKAQAFKNLLQRRFEGLQETSARAVRSVAMQSSIAQSLGSTFGQLNMACVIGLGAILVINGELSAGELAACTLLSGRAMQPLQSAMGLWTNFQTIRVACDNATSVMELPAEDLGAKPEIPKINGEIEFRDVTFGYAGMDEPLIKNLNLHFKAGSMIGIEGDNSSGRSTLLKLMIGIIRPTSGQVTIDGHDIAQHQSHSYREQMAFLSADADVYTGTILDNMTYFRGGRYIRKAMELSKNLGLDDEIKRLPEGYGTHIGDGAGGVLPAGFAQRITIVRAMVDDPKIVLFDNANHGLDSNTDKILLDYFSGLRGKVTVILVSARPSWLRAADTRYIMDHGRVQLKANDDPIPATPPAAETKPAIPAVADAPVQQARPAPTSSTTNQPNPAQQATAPIQADKKPAPAQPPEPAALPAKPTPAVKATPQKMTPTVSAPAQKRPPVSKQAQPRPAKPVQAAPAPRNRPAPAAKPATTSAQQTAARPVAKSVPQPKTPATPPAAPTATPAAKKPEPVRPAAKQAAPAVKPAARPTAKPVAKQASKPVAKPAARPVAKTASATRPKQTTSRPQARPVATPRPAPAQPKRPATEQNQSAPKTATQAKPKPGPQTTPAARPSARPVARPVVRPVVSPAAQPAATTAARPTPNSRPAAGTAKPATKPATTSPTAPKPAATLRPAAAPVTTKAAKTTRPQPPKPRRIDPRNAGLGGAE